MKSRKYVPNCRRAIIDGNIATIYRGRRVVRHYLSGQPLLGKIEGDDRKGKDQTQKGNGSGARLGLFLVRHTR